MFALWGDLTTALHAPTLHVALHRVGVARLQVNVDDAPVAAAMRIPAEDAPIGAILSTWGSTAAQVVATLSDLPSVTRLAGWEVEERRPIAPEEAWDGSRLDALANIALLRRPDELAHEEWLHRWLVDHTPVAIATQGTFGYVQNVVVGALTPDAPAVAAVVEELFPSAAITDIHAFYGSGGSDAELSDRMEKMMASIGRFGADRGLDLVPTSRYLFDLAPTATRPT
ncbi:EthD domain-containing protein [soil metagenome]